MANPDRLELTRQQQKVARAVFDAGCVRFGNFTLMSGAGSPIYVDLRRIRSFPREKRVVVGAYKRLLKPLSFDLLADVPTSATPLVSSLSDSFYRDSVIKPQITPRQDVKGYGSGNQIDGSFQEGQIAVVVDDLITTAASKLRAIGTLTQSGLTVTDVVVLIDRDQGGKEGLKQNGYNLHSSLLLPEMVRFYQAEYPQVVTAAQASETIAYLAEAKRAMWNITAK